MNKWLQKVNYKLVGYDCPLKKYPSAAVPIVRDLFGKYKAVYLNNDLELETKPVVATANFFKLSDCDVNLKNKLESFNCYKQRLLAISETNVEFYEVIDEIYFFIKLLIDKKFSENDPFARVQLAEATGVNDILSKELQIYEQYLREHQKDLLPFWEEDKKAFEDKLQQEPPNSSRLEKMNEIPVPINASASEVGVDYTKLRNLLQNNNFLEADKETARIMLQIFLKKKYKSIGDFPKLDLRTIDNLWIRASNEKFGFSVQKQKTTDLLSNYRLELGKAWRILETKSVNEGHRNSRHFPQFPLLGHMIVSSFGKFIAPVCKSQSIKEDTELFDFFDDFFYRLDLLEEVREWNKGWNSMRNGGHSSEYLTFIVDNFEKKLWDTVPKLRDERIENDIMKRDSLESEGRDLTSIQDQESTSSTEKFALRGAGSSDGGGVSGRVNAKLSEWEEWMQTLKKSFSND